MDQTTSQDSLFGLHVGYTTGNSLRETSKWTTFLSIVFFIVIVIGLFALLLGGSAIVQLYSTGFGDIAGGFVGIIIAVCIAFLGIYFFAALMLFRFSTLIKLAIQNQDQQLFNQSLKAFRNYFLITGIISILGFLYNILLLIISIVPDVLRSIL